MDLQLARACASTDFGLGSRTSRVTCDQIRSRMTAARLRSLRTSDFQLNIDEHNEYEDFRVSRISTDPCENPNFWEPLKLKLFSGNSTDHDKALLALLNISSNSEFLLVNAPPDLLDLLLASVEVYDTCERKYACRRRLNGSSISETHRVFFEAHVNPVIVRHFFCSCVDVLLLWALRFNVHEVRCRLIMNQMACEDDIETKMSMVFLRQLENQGIGVEETFRAAKRKSFSTHQSVVYSHVGKKYELVLAILKNLSANRFNRVIIAQQKNVWRLCLLLTHCTWKNLRLLALDLLSSIADFMYMKSPLEECSLAALILVVKNGMKSQQTFVVQKSVQTIRKWIWCFNARQASASRANFSVISPFLDLPSLALRLGSILYAPERDMILDSLLILIMFMKSKSYETEIVRRFLKTSSVFLDAAVLLIFSRESDFTPIGPIVIGLDTYLASVVRRINNTIRVESIKRHRQKLLLYRQIFKKLLKEVSANPHHRFSRTEIVMCGWSMRTYQGLKPPPFVVKKVLEESVLNEAYREKIYLPYLQLGLATRPNCLSNAVTRRQESKKVFSYALSNYSYPFYKQIFFKQDRMRAISEFPRGYFPGANFFPLSSQMQRRLTLWNHILKKRAIACGKKLGEHPSLPFCGQYKKVGPVSTQIVKITCALLKMIADESPLTRQYLKGMEPKLAYMISCDDDYASCIKYLSSLFESLR